LKKIQSRGWALVAACTLSAAAFAKLPLPDRPAPVDCSSTQTILQGASAECPAFGTPTGSDAPTLAQDNPGTACFAALAGSQAARRIASKVPFFSASAARPAELANTRVPTKREQQELASVTGGYAMCLDMAATWRREAYAPALVTKLDAFWLEAQAILQALGKGRMTYGAAAKAIAENDRAYRSQVNALAAAPKSGP
jgi:hypothetical protein